MKGSKLVSCFLLFICPYVCEQSLAVKHKRVVLNTHVRIYCKLHKYCEYSTCICSHCKLAVQYTTNTYDLSNEWLRALLFITTRLCSLGDLMKTRHSQYSYIFVLYSTCCCNTACAGTLWMYSTVHCKVSTEYSHILYSTYCIVRVWLSTCRDRIESMGCDALRLTSSQLPAHEVPVSSR